MRKSLTLKKARGKSTATQPDTKCLACPLHLIPLGCTDWEAIQWLKKIEAGATSEYGEFVGATICLMAVQLRPLATPEMWAARFAEMGGNVNATTQAKMRASEASDIFSERTRDALYSDIKLTLSPVQQEKLTKQTAVYNALEISRDPIGLIQLIQLSIILGVADMNYTEARDVIWRRWSQFRYTEDDHWPCEDGVRAAPAASSSVDTTAP